MNPLYEDTINFLKKLPIILPDFLAEMSPICKNVAEGLSKFENLFCLGKGFGEAIAKYLFFKF